MHDFKHNFYVEYISIFYSVPEKKEKKIFISN